MTQPLRRMILAVSFEAFKNAIHVSTREVTTFITVIFSPKYASEIVVPLKRTQLSQRKEFFFDPRSTKGLIGSLKTARHHKYESYPVLHKSYRTPLHS